MEKEPPINNKSPKLNIAPKLYERLIILLNSNLDVKFDCVDFSDSVHELRNLKDFFQLGSAFDYALKKTFAFASGRGKRRALVLAQNLRKIKLEIIDHSS